MPFFEEAEDEAAQDRRAKARTNRARESAKAEKIAIAEKEARRQRLVALHNAEYERIMGVAKQ